MSSAQRNLLPLDEAPEELEAGLNAGTEAEAPFALKEQVAQRLTAHRACPHSAHRQRRHSHRQTGPREPPRLPHRPGSCAERYANSQKLVSAPSSPNKLPAPFVPAEAAPTQQPALAQAVADAQYQLLAELDQWTLTPPPTPEAPATPQPRIPESSSAPATPL